MKHSVTLKKGIFLVILITLFTNIYSQNLSVTNQSKSGLSLELTIDKYDIKEIQSDGDIFHEVALNSITIPADKGKPNLPTVNRFIAIPQGSNPKIVVKSYKKEILKNINIAPSKGIVSEYELTDKHYTKDESIYSKDELYPANIVSTTEKMKLRGIDAVMLNISPLQYNPVSKELIVYTEINLTIEYEDGNNFGDDRLRSMYWDPILQHNILNYDVLPKINYSERMQDWTSKDAEGAEYIIIIPDNESYREQAQRLADYRSKQGIITKVYSLGDIDAHNPEDIKNWFADAYNNWEIVPVAACLLGNYNTVTTLGIPCFTFYFNNYNDEPYISDRPYSDIDNDFLPDMAFSRLCAANAGEAKIMVDKQINYEFTNPVMDEDFYKNPITTGAYQLSKWFQISTESINGYLKKINKEPYRYNMVYYYNGDYDPVRWSSADNSEQIINYFGPNGLGYIPATPGEVGGYLEYTNDESHLINKISEEPGYILQNRDHGWFSIWDCPKLSESNIKHLANHGKLPFILSINCGSGAFDKNYCLTEALMKYENKGAVGVIAATYETYTYTNDSFLLGIWDFFENNFLPDYGTSTKNNNCYMPAFANTSAKHFIFQQNFPNTSKMSREETSNLFHAHCDAFLKLYSEVPQQMNIEHDESYIIGSNTLNIKAPSGSVIALSVEKSDKVVTLAVAEGTGSMQTLNFPNIVSPEDKLYVTVTKTNHLRYEENIDITTNDAYVTMKDFNLYDDSQELILDQDTYIDFKLKNIGHKDASTVNLSLTCNSDALNITNNNNIIDGININEVVELEDAFFIDIVGGINNGSIITFTLDIEHDGMSHKEYFEVLVNSYKFEVTEISAEETDGNGNNLIDPNEFAKITLTVENTGRFPMEDIIANLISNNNYVRVISNDIPVNSINIGEKTDLEFETYIDWNILPEPVSFTLEFDIDNYIIRHNFDVLLGMLVENFEGQTINDSWQNNSNRPWYIDISESYEGEHSLRSGTIGDEESSQISITIETIVDQNISFYYKVSSEESWDYFYFSIDGEDKLAASGETGWKYVEFPISKGTHTYTWKYVKDFMAGDGQDCAWIDNITFPCSSFTEVKETNHDDNLTIYPNPTEYFIKIELRDDNIRAKNISIYNSAGLCIYNNVFINEVDVRDFPSGLYLIKINFDDYTHIEKVIIE